MTTQYDIPTPEEFIESASAAKVQLIERLAAMMLTRDTSWRSGIQFLSSGCDLKGNARNGSRQRLSGRKRIGSTIP